MIEPLLQMSDIEKSFFGTSVLQGISLQVGQRRTVGLVGENGAGQIDADEYSGWQPAPRRRPDAV